MAVLLSGLDEDSARSDRLRRPLRKRELLGLIALVAVAGLVAILVSPARSPELALAGGVSSSQTAAFAGGTLSPVIPVPALALRNYKGEAVNIREYRGKAVLVTFLYTNCQDVCPIIAANLRVAQNLMGNAEDAKVQVIAVSVDPRGDTPTTVAKFLARHQMTGRMQYLIGSTPELGRAWSTWNVGSERDAQEPNLVNHSGLVYGVSASGKLVTVYPANFSPANVAHDVASLVKD
jgi:protein SCO1